MRFRDLPQLVRAALDSADGAAIGRAAESAFELSRVAAERDQQKEAVLAQMIWSELNQVLRDGRMTERNRVRIDDACRRLGAPASKPALPSSERRSRSGTRPSVPPNPVSDVPVDEFVDEAFKAS